MPDWEDVITSLDYMRLLADLRVHEIVSPDNWDVYSDLCDLIDLAKESALALLREKEAAKPKREVNENGQILSCGNCGAWFTVQKQKYCHECGRAVKWDA